MLKKIERGALARRPALQLLTFQVVFVSLFLNSPSSAIAAWSPPVELMTTGPLKAWPHVGSSALAVDRNGAAHTMYVAKSGKTYTLIHKTNKSGVWDQEAIVSSPMMLSVPQAVIHKGHIYLVWQKGTKRRSEIFYANNASGAWSISKVTSNSSVDINPVISMHSGKVYIAWLKSDQPEPYWDAAIYFRTNASGRWRTEKISDKNYMDEYGLQMVIDRRGTVHIVYAIEGDRLYYLNNASGNWQQERVLTGVDQRGRPLFAYMPSLTIDKDFVYIAFVRRLEQQISLAVRKRGVWQVTKVTGKSKMNESVFPRILVDRGHVKIAYTKFMFADASGGLVGSQPRLSELVHGRWRSESIDVIPPAVDSSSGTPQTLTEYFVSGFENAGKSIHVVYLRSTRTYGGPDIVSLNLTLLYGRRDPD